MKRFGACPSAVGVCLAALVLMATGWWGTASAQSRDEGILAIGTAPLKGGNVAAARQGALADALQKGVEEYLLRRLGEEAVAGQLSRFVTDLIPAARDEIANYNILGEEEFGDTYRVLARIRINEQTLERTLDDKGFLREQGPPVKVLFMVSQRTAGAEDPEYWWGDPESGGGLLPVELALNRAFESMGFSLASRTLKVPEGEDSQTLTNADLTWEDAAEWGRLCAADVVVLGSCVLREGILSIRLRAIESASASLLAEQGGQASLDPSLEGEERTSEGIGRVVKSVAAPFAARIREAFQRAEADPERITLTLRGVGSFTLLQQFTRFVREGVPGVESVTQTRFKGDTVTFSVGYREGADRFLDSLLALEERPFPLTAQKNESGEIVVTPL